MARKQYYVCQQCKDIHEEPLTLHIFGNVQCTTLLDVCKKCHKQYMDDLALAASRA